MKSLENYLLRQEEWSAKTFGRGCRTEGLIQHIQKELEEIRKEPHDLKEWVDVMILALDGFWRHGGNPLDILVQLYEKQDVNFARKWPTPTSESVAVEHIREQPEDAGALGNGG